MAVIAHGRPLIDGEAEGPLLVLRAPISFWGGVDPATGTISRPDHPDHGHSIAGTILALPAVIGSSSSSAVMLELLRNGNAPAGILMADPDAILTIGVVVAREMGWGSIPVFVCPLEALGGWRAVSLRTGGIIEGDQNPMSAPAYPFVLETNPLADRNAPYGPDQAAILNDEAYERARATISAWPGYAPTPLVALPGIAAAIGVASIHYKDEAPRFGLGSFKALGGAYAVCRLLQRLVGERTGAEPTTADLVAGRSADVAAGITVCCATDGNHGRSVAWGARTFGCKCVIFVHETVSDARRQAIEAFGATVVRTPGNYDDSVHIAQDTADREGWFVVSDTSYEGYTEVPRDVMQGYELMAAEALGQWPDPEPVTHIFLQTGVGGMAAAVAAWVWRRRGARRPAIVLADPLRSACWLETIRAGRPTAVTGDLDTMMAGLACGEVSILAWTILKHAADAVIAIDDDVAVDCMRLMAEGRYGDRPVVAGESAVAGLAALLAVAGDKAAGASLSIDARSRILLFGTEGDTDPALYEQLVGRSADDVRSIAP